MAKTIVWLPGWGFRAAIWKDIAGAFPEYQHIFLELPALPKNVDPLSILLPYFRKTIPKEAIVVAWSLGGLLATQFCAQITDHASQLILLGSNPKFLESKEWPGLTETFAKQFIEKANDDLPNLMREFITLVQLPLRKIELRQFVKWHLISSDEISANLNPYLELIVSTDARPHYSNLTLPTSHIFAMDDVLVPYDALDHCRRLNQRVSFLTIKEAPHAPFLTHKGELIKILQSELI